MALTSKKLGITDKKRTALKKVRDGLRSGLYKHVADPYYDNKKSDKPVFNMNYKWSQFECGQVACIGGWMAIAMGKKPLETMEYVDGNQPLHDLFFPPHEIDYDDITPKMAAKAIDNFMDTGNPNWEKVAKRLM